MKFKLKSQINNNHPGSVVEVNDSYNVEIKDAMGVIYWVPISQLEMMGNPEIEAKSPGSLISVTQKMKSLNIEFK